MHADIHLQRCPCPRCHSVRTIQTDASGITETLCCPDCEHSWDRVVPTARAPATRRLFTATSRPAPDRVDDVSVPTPITRASTFNGAKESRERGHGRRMD